MKADTELFELSKQVYEATGWDSLEWGVLTHPWWDKELECDVSLYTSDYLLERLPWKVPGRINYCLMMRRYKDKWYVWYDGSAYIEYGNTLLLALLRLTLALHKANLLTTKETK